MPGVVEPSELPAHWEELNGVTYCLSCRRRKAGEEKAATLSDEDPAADLRRADAEGRIEFELSRTPDRCDTRIARACGTYVALVKDVRERLSAYPTGPA
jgi:hypothetical protein